MAQQATENTALTFIFIPPQGFFLEILVGSASYNILCNLSSSLGQLYGQKSTNYFYDFFFN